MQLLDCFAPEIDLLDPVVRSHQLNLDRTAWWLALPGLMGGGTWRDLIGKNTGIFSGPVIPAVSTAGWHATSRPGGFGQYNYDGSVTSNNMNVTDSPALNFGTGPFTIGCWVKMSSGDTSAPTLIQHNSSASPYTGYSISVDGTTGAAIFSVTDAAGNVDQLVGTKPVNDGNWHRVVGVHSISKSTEYLYVDGALDNYTTLYATGSTNYPSTLATAYGFSGGALDDQFLAARDWTVQDIKLDWQLYRLGYPGVLNRVAYQYTSSSSASFHPAWASNSSTLYTGQIYV